MISEIHECKTKIGKIIDVSTRNDGIYCRGCNKLLNENQVDERVLERIKIKLNKQWSRERR